MNPLDLLNRMPPGLARALEKPLRSLPGVGGMIEKEYDGMMGDLAKSVKPYQEGFDSFTHLPAEGRNRADILDEMQRLRDREESRWREGFVSGAVYHGDQAHIDFLNQVYALHSQSNPLHSDIWPSAAKFEAEIVAMTAHMLGADRAGAGPQNEVVGTVSSGGTESILLAMKTYRDRARAKKGIKHPEMVVPSSAHAAFDKAAQYFGIRLVRVPVGPDYRADLVATERAITKNTIVLVGSAPCFPHGVVDPIEALSELAHSRGIGFHTDACLGGFVLPWAEKLGYQVPPVDFRLPGVTSISCDTHKYGYAAKGTSVVLYRGRELRRYQYYTVADWPGGLYFSPTFAGSRPGALSAACWAALVTTGQTGYMQATRQIMQAAATIKQGIAQIPELRVLGDPLFVIAFASDRLDIYRVLDAMGHRGWNLNGLHHPPAVHICVTLRHTQAGVAERFVADLQASVAQVKAQPKTKGGMAPVYGMAATIPFKGMVTDLLQRYIDLLYSTGETGKQPRDSGAVDK
ncbi:MAG: aminotransferase class V-fold PLP-dependent enzyme [Anaerolineae bacterium]